MTKKSLKKKKFKILARHKWTYGATITESVEREEGKIRRFTATIRGFQNWLLYEGPRDLINQFYLIAVSDILI